jgi:NADPH2:quinone reductase
MPKAIQIHRNGGPEVLSWDDTELAPPGPGEVRIRHTAIAVNYSDINVREGGFYMAKPLDFPVIIGNEAAGVIEAVGTSADGARAGERAAYVGVGGPFYENTGAYAEARNVPASCLFKPPAKINDDQAAAMLLKGLTASMVIHRYCKPAPGDHVLIHAAASGVGLLLVQWCRHLGATVIGTVGSAAKAKIASALGCEHTILYRDVDFVGAVRDIVPDGVAAVLDGVGKDTFAQSIHCTRRHGMLVNYGNASGHPDPLDLLLLAKHGSLTVARPAFSDHIRDAQDRARYSDELYDLVDRGILKVEIGQTYPLSKAADAHRDLEGRKYAGSLLLKP